MFYPYFIRKITPFNFLCTESFTLKTIFEMIWAKEKMENMHDLQIKKPHEEKLTKNLNPGLYLIFSKYRQIYLEFYLLILAV